MQTYFASPERIDGEELEKEIELICNTPLIDALMNVSSGLMSVINEHRQVVAINETYLKLLGLDNPKEVFGLRMGECLNCIHSHELSGGCGTSEHCSSCGAVIATVTSLGKHIPVDEQCVVSVNRNEKLIELFFSVRSVPITVKNKQFILLFLHDISNRQQWTTMERVFIHDINNYLTGIIGKSELLLLEQENNQLVRDVLQQSLRVAQEFKIHRCLMKEGIDTYKPIYQAVTAGRIVEEIELMFSNHEISNNKVLLLPENVPRVSLNTDLSLVIRVLGNMIKNAFEASDDGDEVKFTIECKDELITFSIGNNQPIPSKISKRIFQRNYTTKEGDCRGLGTYSMKLFGENILGGRVDFETSEENGTVFHFRHKIEPQPTEV